jgi:S1-C subfamily serine protease
VLSIGRNAGRLRQVLDAVFRTLEGKYLLVPYARDANANTTYRVVSDQGRQLFDNDAYQEYLFGILRVVQRWRSSVFRLVNRKGDGVATAFLIAPRQIATAKHVIEEMPDFVVQSEQGHELKHSQVRLHEATGVDLAVVMLDEPVNMRAFRIADEYDLLDPVVVFGYPPIPRTNDAYLVVNRGEISAKPTLYGENREIIIVTCLLRGGNSGGPVVDVTGAVVGVVSRHLFKQVAASEQSINESLGFAAATPARHLRDFR